jgi:multisubunit Na+/H+ antiporter MnhB subunit
MDPIEAKRDLAQAIRWYEESPNVTSSTRVFTAVILVLATAICALMITYTIVSMVRHEKPDAGFTGTLAGALTALAANVAANVATRNKGVN